MAELLLSRFRDFVRSSPVLLSPPNDLALHRTLRRETGKSTLLSASSNAKPKIADYPFTTIVPNLGVCDLLDFHESDAATKNSQGGGGGSGGLVLADIPGLLEGAHEGVGMGIAFLRRKSPTHPTYSVRKSERVRR